MRVADIQDPSNFFRVGETVGMNEDIKNSPVQIDDIYRNRLGIEINTSSNPSFDTEHLYHQTNDDEGGVE